jgi:hypothetical protein
MPIPHAYILRDPLCGFFFHTLSTVCQTADAVLSKFPSAHVVCIESPVQHSAGLYAWTALPHSEAHCGFNRDTKNHAGQRNAMHVQLCTVLVLVLYLLECALETASLNTAVAEPLDAVQLAELGAIGRTVTAL